MPAFMPNANPNTNPDASVRSHDPKVFNEICTIEPGSYGTGRAVTIKFQGTSSKTTEVLTGNEEAQARVNAGGSWSDGMKVVVQYQLVNSKRVDIRVLRKHTGPAQPSGGS